MSESQPAKRARILLSASEKKAICLHKAKNPKANRNDLTAWVQKEFKKSIGRQTISDVLHNKERWLAVCHDCRTLRDASCAQPELEEALWLWFTNARASNKTIKLSDDMIISKAKDLGQKLKIDSFSYSNGWLERFKKRHGIKRWTLHGESGSVDMDIVIQ